MAAGSGNRQQAVLHWQHGRVTISLDAKLIAGNESAPGPAWPGLVIMGHGHGQGVGVYYANISALTRAGK